VGVRLGGTIILFLVGLAIAAVGIWEIFWPAALIAIGTSIMGVAALVIDAKPDPPRRDEPL
jgi:type IV secretory pathway TrbD component